MRRREFIAFCGFIGSLGATPLLAVVVHAQTSAGRRLVGIFILVRRT